jgi:hypothetical protein
MGIETLLGIIFMTIMFRKENVILIILIIFVIITSIVAIGALLANLGLFGEEVRKAESTKWFLTSVIGPIVTVVILVLKSELIYKGNFWINIDFIKDPTKHPLEYENIIDYNREKSSYKIRLHKDIVEQGKLDLVPDKTGPQPIWQWFAPIPLNRDHIIKMEIHDNKGKIWKVNARPSMSFEAT